jgi:MoxR-like ATPase
MGQPNPPGDIPLYDGLGAEWNDIVGAFPEDQRAALAPKLKERIDSFEPLKEYSDFAKSGIKPDQISAALNIFSVLENNPREVYETIGKHLGITPAQAEKVVEELEEADQDDPRIAELQHKVDTLAQIALAERQQTTQEKLIQEQEELVGQELEAVKKKYGTHDYNEDEILMRMIHKEMTAEQAYQDYTGHVQSIRSRRPAPTIMGAGGNIPNRAIDPKTLSGPETKSVVAQMLEHARNA